MTTNQYDGIQPTSNSPIVWHIKKPIRPLEGCRSKSYSRLERRIAYTTSKFVVIANHSNDSIQIAEAIIVRVFIIIDSPMIWANAETNGKKDQSNTKFILRTTPTIFASGFASKYSSESDYSRSIYRNLPQF